MSPKETILITGENGALAKKLKNKLINLGYNIITYTSQKNLFKKNCYYWNFKENIIDVESLKKCEHIIHLSGYSIIKPWTKKNKKIMFDSRVKTSDFLFENCFKNNINIKTFISASAIGIYNDDSEIEMCEDDELGNSWLSNLAQQWESSSHKFNKIGSRVVNLRISLLIDKDSGFLKKMLPLFKIGIVPLIGNKNNRFEYIDIDDAVNFCIKCLKNITIKGPYNLATNKKSTQIAFMKKIADLYNKRFLIIKIPEIIMKVILGKRFKIINSNIKVSSKKIIETGFKFQEITNIINK